MFTTWGWDGERERRGDIECHAQMIADVPAFFNGIFHNRAGTLLGTGIGVQVRISHPEEDEKECCRKDYR